MSIQYTIDSADHIRFINEAWLQFACQNDGAHLNRAFVIGKSLWDFIEGEDLRHLYTQIFRLVRTKHHTMVFRFRCDSPACRRYFLMTLSPLLESSLMISTHAIREEMREPVALLDPLVQRDEPFLRICSWCVKACLPPTDEWVELEEANKRLGFLEGGVVPRLTHGICQECHRMIDLEIKSLV